MPIDASIPLQVKPIQLDNPLQQYGNVLAIQNAMNQNRLADLQYSQLQTQQADEEAVKRAFADASGNVTGARNALMSKGLYKPALALDEAERKRRKEETDTLEKELKIRKEKLEMFGGLLSPLAAKERLTFDDMKALNEQAKQMGILPDGIAASIPNNEMALQGYVRGLAFLTEQGRKAVEAQMPKPEKIDSGAQIGFVNVNPLVGTVGQQIGNAIQKQVSPGQQLTADTAIRGQDLSAQTAREGQGVTMRGQDLTRLSAIESGQRAGLHFDPERGLVINTQSGTAAPVTGPSGQPIGDKDKPLTDAQAKALLFGSRMQEANKIFDELAKGGTTTGVPGSRAPVVGPVIGAAQSTSQQKLDQAKRDFINAVLRRESGAVITDAEFANAEKQYFPQIGDADSVKAQKQRNREVAMRGILAEVPEKQREKLVGEILKPSGKTASAAGGKSITRAEAQALATQTGKTVDEVLAAARSRGYTVK